VDLTKVVAVSTFALLFTYSITNISAFKLKENLARHKVMPLLGLVTCLMLLVFVLLASPQAWVIGVAFLVVGTIYYVAWKKLKQANRQKLS
jgi:amino acid transporter